MPYHPDVDDLISEEDVQDLEATDKFSRQALEKLSRLRRRTIVLDRATCDWVIDEQADTAICRTHGEVVDGRASKHFPGKGVDHESSGSN